MDPPRRAIAHRRFARVLHADIEVWMGFAEPSRRRLTHKSPCGEGELYRVFHL